MTEKRRAGEKADENNPSFESSMKRLESIVSQLEQGDLALEKSLALFEEGVELARRLELQLGDAEMTVEKLLRGPGDSERIETLEVPEDGES